MPCCGGQDPMPSGEMTGSRDSRTRRIAPVSMLEQALACVVNRIRQDMVERLKKPAQDGLKESAHLRRPLPLEALFSGRKARGLAEKLFTGTP